MPRTGRPRGFDKAEAIEKAMLLLWERGIAATSLADLKTAMGIASPTSFYAAFGSKEALLEDVVARYLAGHGQVMSALRDPSLTAREAIARALRETVRMQTDPSHPAGCLVALSAADGVGTDSAIARLLAAERRRNSAGIVACVERAVRDGALSDETDVSGLATMIDATLSGLSLRARDGAGREDLGRAVDALMRVWDAHSPADRTDSGVDRRTGTRKAGRGP